MSDCHILEVRKLAYIQKPAEDRQGVSCVPSLQGKDLLFVVGIYGTVVLKWVLKERGVKIEAIFDWFKIVSSGGRLENL
jgi:hypothetical protein